MENTKKDNMFSFTAEALSNMTDIQSELIDHLHYDKSHQGFLLTLSDEEFQKAYSGLHIPFNKMTREKRDQIYMEAAILLKYRDDKNQFSPEEVYHMCREVLTSYSLISLAKKGLVKYEPGKNDSEWKWEKIEGIQVEGYSEEQ